MIGTSLATPEDDDGWVVFKFGDFMVRGKLFDGKVGIVASDIAKPLGYRMASDATRILPSQFLSQQEVRTPGGLQKVTTVTEAGVYRLIMRSQMPNAEQFQAWVTDDVLPAIRRTGMYVAPAVQHHIPATLADALQLAADQAREIEAQNARLDWAEPRAKYVDSFVNGSADDTSVRDLAAQLRGEGVIDKGEQRLREWMIERGLIYRKHLTVHGRPQAQYRPQADLGVRRSWFTLHDQPTAPRADDGQILKTLYITPAGKVGITELLKRYPI